jgi:signal transduction histidine kinase
VLVQHQLKHRIQVHKDYGQLPLVQCHPDQINQVFMNLLVNAGQAIEGRGDIHIRTRHEGGRVAVEMHDSGKGIPKEHIARIFDPGFTTKGVGVGTGLGLSIVHGIVDEHHGTIEVESEPGQGTTFRVWLPIEHSDSE